MAAKDRQLDIIRFLKQSETAVSGSALSSEFNVSRQIIVKDMNALRAAGHHILSTSKGYIYVEPDCKSRVFKTYHSDEDTEKELNLIVDMGGEVVDVFIFHKVYGIVKAKLGVQCRRDAAKFCEDMKSGKSSLLKNATSGYHYHTVNARDEATLDIIEDALWEKGFLAKLQDYEPESIKR